MLLEVAPASFDIVQFGGVFRQPLDGEPGALGKRAGCLLAGVDRPVVENRDQGPGAFGGAVGGTELIEQVEGVAWAPGGKPPLRNWCESHRGAILGPPRRAISAHRRGSVQPPSWRASSVRIAAAIAPACGPILACCPGRGRRRSPATRPCAK